MWAKGQTFRFPFQCWTKKTTDTSKQPTMRTILRTIGLNESVSWAKGEQLAFGIGQSYLSDRPLTSEEREKHALRRHLIEEGERGNWQPLFDARAQGQIDQREQREIEYDVKLGPLAVRVEHFKSGDFLKVYEAVTPGEKRQLDRIRLRNVRICCKKGNWEAVATSKRGRAPCLWKRWITTCCSAGLWA